jgi:hypothetical protein
VGELEDKPGCCGAAKLYDRKTPRRRRIYSTTVPHRIRFRCYCAAMSSPASAR